VCHAKVCRSSDRRDRLGRSASLKADDYNNTETGGFPCGKVGVGNSSGQYGQYSWLQYIIKTTGSLDIWRCE
jgi:hypothetical protein